MQYFSWDYSRQYPGETFPRGCQINKPLTMGKIKINFDGSCGPNNPGGKMGFGFVVIAMVGSDVQRITGKSETEPHPTNTNNVAEYTALLNAMETVIEQFGVEHDVDVFGDSMLVIQQMTGNWRIKSGFYEPVARECITVANKFKKISFTWVSRTENTHADELSRT